MKNGVPFDVAFSLEDKDRAAMCIVFSEMEGAKFNWDRMDWEDQR